MRPGAGRAAFSLAVLLIGGCAAPGPTENPLDTPEDGLPVVSVCYAPLLADRVDDIEPVAREACAAAGIPDATLRYWKKDHILNECPLFKKSRISFYCEPGAAGGGAAVPGPPADDDAGAEESGDGTAY
jgi:hypothetical protein